MKKMIIGIIIGIVLCSGVVYAASTIASSSVTYGDRTVNEVLDDLITKINVGNATASQILSGRTALVQGQLVTGTIISRGEIGGSINAGETFSVPPGYTTGGTVTANSLASQTSATATAADITSGKTAWVNGNLITGNATNVKPSITIPSISGHNSAGKTVEARLNIDVTEYNTLTIGSATCTTGASTTTNNTVKVTDTETSETLYTGKRTAVNNTVVDLTGHNKIRITGSAYWEAMESGSSYQVTIKNIVIE